MASNPPFHMMEDQTDEDFFDKLVDDDFGPTSSDTFKKLAEGSDSDEAKAFSNLSIEDTSVDDGVEVKGQSELASGVYTEESNALDSSYSLGPSDVIKANNDVIVSQVAPDPVVSKTIESSKSGVKEVGWSSFYADSVPNGNHGFGSYSDFFNDLDDTPEAFPDLDNTPPEAFPSLDDTREAFPGKAIESEPFPGKAIESANVENKDGVGLHNSVSHVEYQAGALSFEESVDETANGQDLNSSQYWESMYPGWKYDANTGQWYQVDDFGTAASLQESFNANAGNALAAVSDGKSELNYLQQTSQSLVGTVAETSTSQSVSTWNQVPQETDNGYPEHMIFDPQYPGWYYDTIAQEWRSLESYTSSTQSTTIQNNDQQKQNEFAINDAYSQHNNSVYGGHEQADKHGSQVYDSQGQHGMWGETYSNYNQQNLWQPDSVARSDTASNFVVNQQSQNSYVSNLSMTNHVDQQKSYNSLGTVPSYDKMSQGHVEANGFMPNGSFVQQFNQGNVKQNEQMNVLNDFYGSQKQVNVAQQSYQSSQQFNYAPNTGRSSAGRPPHALVTFGFGGKLIVMKDTSSSSLGNSSFGQELPSGSISVLNMLEILSGSTNNVQSVGGSKELHSYFHALCQETFPGPLMGGNVGSKELHKWIDERISNCESCDMDYRKAEVLKLLLSLLKIACQHYGKLRSPFGTDALSKESDAPESAVAKLFASANRNGTQFTDYSALSQCLQGLPSEGQIRATASEVQKLLVSGRKREALQCAQEGQLWGPALVLATQLGDQFYVDTVKQMALRQLVAGSPLRTLCLLIAGQPADVFSTETPITSGPTSAMSQQPIQFGANCMLDDWEENLAVITANRTKDDELVIIHLGDCLWKERSEIAAAHICYLVAEANFESYSDSARLCLIGADHWKHPRTYVSPEAIQRTELYEYSKVLGNSQFILLPFQPYKLVYAYMLAEVGKVSDSLKYCQAILKSLKTGRGAPEVETWKQLVLSLDERIRTHQQGGYTNLAPGKLVGALLNFFDSTAHRVVGGPRGLPPPVPSSSQGNLQGSDHHHQPMVARVSASQSTMAMSSLVPSESVERISEWTGDGNRLKMHSRSVSEPDIGRTPRQVDSSKETSPGSHGKTSGSGTASRFGRFGFGSQLLQKTVGLVLRPRSDKQAKLGEKNKFYYDDKLKRWIEEGVDPPAEEAALPPPPTTSAFQNGTPDYNLKSALKNDGSPPSSGSPTFKSAAPLDHSSGIPPIPTSSNQFSARGRMGVRARYVDTFNQGGGSSAKLFQSPSVPAVKPPVSVNAKFFVPSPPPASENSMETFAENVPESSGIAENPSTSAGNSFESPSKMNMQRFPSMGNISRNENGVNGNAPALSFSSPSRRTASWSGSFNSPLSPPRAMEPSPLGEPMRRVPSSSFMPVDPSMANMQMNRNTSIGDDLQEVEL
ncbi:protein transport protein SEC16B homolog [Euphorbia lathyris]|uniref:protein transport protein SEC16B homolog n=1 Tax=Euphorbia lathyris TaxID=212925 RepID=UPI00331363EA